MGIRSFLTRRKKKKSSPRSLPESPTAGRLSSTRSEVEELKQVFQKFDANSDGKISWYELGSIMNSLGHPASEEELQRMVKEADSDGDGFIDLNEFIELNTNGIDRMAALEDLKNAFLIFDMDRDGSISPEELQMVLRSLGDESSMDDCRKMINGVDCNGDGLIDFEEFKIMMTRSLEIPITHKGIEVEE
ncbi:hypothetical protein AAC387_Pa02g5007 [Persea americana]